VRVSAHPSMWGEPARRLRCSSSRVKLVSLLSVSGSWPANWFCPSLSFCSVVKVPSESGNVPRRPGRRPTRQI
jgi:hypothetical protein